MTKIIVVNRNVDFRKVFACAAGFNLQSSFSTPKLGTVLIASPEQEDNLIAALRRTFESDNVEVFEAETFIPTDWSKPGFVNHTLQAEPGNVAMVMTSGLGLHLVKE